MLTLIADSPSPLTLAALVHRTGLHENTLRGHVDALVQSGRLTRVPVRTGGRGRPAYAYVARGTHYADLAIALAAGLENRDSTPVEAARLGGHAWGERLLRRLGAADAEPRQRLRLVLEHAGFDPDVDPSPDHRVERIRLRRCPLRAAADTHRDVVCSAHLGLIEAVLGGDGPRLTPSPAGQPCLLEIPTHSAEPPTE